MLGAYLLMGRFYGSKANSAPSELEEMPKL